MTGPSTDSECILVFLRAPAKGRVKTRLGRLLGAETALSLYRCFVADILAAAAKSGPPVWLCYTPAGAKEQIARWLGSGYPMMPQRGANLGRRMADAFQNAFSLGVRRAVLVGTDIPDLPPGRIGQAFDCLRSFSSVIGPTHDGGYYLIGFRVDGFTESVFVGQPWGSGRVFEETLAAFRRENETPCLLERWFDIDRPEDLSAFMRRQAGAPGKASATAAFLAERFPDGPPT